MQTNAKMFGTQKRLKDREISKQMRGVLHRMMCQRRMARDCWRSQSARRCFGGGKTFVFTTQFSRTAQ